MKVKTEQTIVVQIFIAGSMATIERCCQEFCDKVGLCVSVEKTTFIYTKGKETGAAIRLVNYPRFPSNLRSIDGLARTLATMLMRKAKQQSALIVGPIDTTWLTNRPEDQ